MFASQLDLAVPWFNPSSGTPELFHGCALYSSWVSVPYQPTGGIQLARSGIAYAGIYTYDALIPNMREYIEVALEEPLEAGQCYYFEMHVNQPNDHPLASDGIGVYFSAGEKRLLSAGVFGLVPHIDNPQGLLITDTLNWVRVSGHYQASGGEDHLIIGNFRDDNHTRTRLVAQNVWYGHSAYLLVDDVYLGKYSLPRALGPDTAICRGDSILLQADGTWDSYLWSTGSLEAAILVGQAGSYWLTSRLGSCSRTDTISLAVEDAPGVNLGADTLLCTGDSLLLDASCWGARYQWQDGSTASDFWVRRAGVFSVQLSNRCGMDRDTVKVDYRDCFCQVAAPNVFTPNGDGLNDVFKPDIDCRIEEYHLQVFNRWGVIVFETRDPLAYWDGRHQGREASAGVYFWHLVYRGNNNGSRLHDRQSGSIHLLRYSGP